MGLGSRSLSTAAPPLSPQGLPMPPVSSPPSENAQSPSSGHAVASPKTLGLNAPPPHLPVSPPGLPPQCGGTTTASAPTPAPPPAEVRP